MDRSSTRQTDGRMDGDVDRRGLLEEPAECSVLFFFYRRTCVKENIRFSLVAPASASICVMSR